MSRDVHFPSVVAATILVAGAAFVGWYFGRAGVDPPARSMSATPAASVALERDADARAATGASAPTPPATARIGRAAVSPAPVTVVLPARRAAASNPAAPAAGAAGTPADQPVIAPLPREGDRQAAAASEQPQAGQASAARATSDDRPGHGIAGRVLQEGGAPAAGLRVQAVARQLFSQPATSQVRASVTDASGRFEFEGLADGVYQLNTDDTDAFEPATAAVRTGAGVALLVVYQKSGRSLFVHGRVDNARGGVLAGARVVVAEQPALAATSDGSGEYSLRIPVTRRLEQASLRFMRDGFRDERLPVAGGIVLSESDIVANVRLEPLGASAFVAGVVRGDDGLAVAGAAVQLTSPEARVFPGTTDAAGRFAIEADEAPGYTLWVRPQSRYKDRTLQDVQAASVEAPIEIVLDSLGVTNVTGVMVDAAGVPVPGFTLWLTSQYGGANRMRPVTSGSDGRFAVERVPEGAIELTTRGEPQLSISGLRVSASSTPPDLRLPLDVGSARLDGVVSDGAAPVAGARVSLQWSAVLAGGAVSRSVRDAISDATGHFVFSRISPGVHTLIVTGPGIRGVQLQPIVAPDAAPVQVRVHTVRSPG